MLMFYALYRLVGPATFRSIIGDHTARHHAGGATTAEFVAEAERAGGPRVAPLFRDWLYTARWLEVLSSGADVRTLGERYRKSAPTQ
jgi:aminopeptidase N